MVFGILNNGVGMGFDVEIETEMCMFCEFVRSFVVEFRKSM